MTLHLGKVKPGSTLYIPFDTFAGSTGASITMTGLATSDILIYKSGGTTQRASTTGFTLLDTDGIDFDGVTGIHGLSIDLSSNATADFYTAGAMYWVVISTITVDSQTVSFVLATFTIGYEGAILDTTIVTLSSQTSFTLTTGPAEDDALNGCEVIIHDIASAVQAGRAIVSDYTGSTKTVTLVAGTTFTAAAGDNISVFLSALQPTVQGRALDVSAGGEAGLDWANIGSPTTAQNLSATNIDVDQVVASVSGAVGSVTGNVGGNVTGSIGSVATGGITSGSFASGAITNAAIATDAIGAAELAADAVAEIADAVWDEDATGHQTQGTFGQAIGDPTSDSDTIWGLVNTNLDAAVSTRASQTSVNTIDDFLDTEIAGIITTLGTPAGASISADIAAIEAQTDDIGAAGAGLTAIPWNAAWDAEVQSEVADALAVYDPPTNTEMEARTLAAASYATASALDTVDNFIDTEVGAIKAVTDKLDTALELDGAVYRYTTNALEQAPGGLTVQAIVDGVWDEALADHLDSGTTGAGLNAAGSAGDPWATSLPGSYGAGTAGKIVGDNINATISSRATPAQVNTEADTALADAGVTTTVTGRIDAAISTRLASASYAAPLDAAGVRGAVGLASANLDTQLTAIDDFLDTEVAAIKAKTDNLPSDPADQSAVEAAITAATSGLSTLTAAGVRTAVGLASANLDTQLGAIDDFLDTEIAAIKAQTDLIPASPAAVGSAMTLSNAGIDAIFDRTDGVETGYTLRQALRIMAAALAGELSGAATTTITIRNITDTKARITATVDSDGNRTALTLDGT